MWIGGVKTRRPAKHRVQGHVHRTGFEQRLCIQTLSEGTGEWKAKGCIPGAALLGGEVPRDCETSRCEAL